MMKLLTKLGGLTLALALCAGLLAGCGATADKAVEPAEEEAAQTQEVEESGAQATEETGEEPAEAEEADPAEEGEPGFDSAALAEALNDVCAVGPGTAGSNLRAVKAAGELVNFAALNWTEESGQAIQEAVAVWFQGLDEEAAEEFTLAWGMVAQQARDIAATPTATETLALLSDAGLDLDLSALDLTHTSDLVEAIDAIPGPNE